MLNLTRKRVAVSTAVITAALGASLVTGCSASKPASTSTPDPAMKYSAPATNAPTAQQTAQRVEASITKALPGGTWSKTGGDLEGAYEQDEFFAPRQSGSSYYSPSAAEVELFDSHALALQALPAFLQSGGYQYEWVDGSALVLVFNGADPATVAVLKANH